VRHSYRRLTQRQTCVGPQRVKRMHLHGLDWT
jgi:hypothetical protein